MSTECNNPAPVGIGAGIGADMRLDRRSALSMAGLLAGLAMLPASTLLAGCAARSDAGTDHSTLVSLLLGLVIPPTDTPGAGTQENMAFVLRAVDAGLMNTPVDTLARLEEDLDYRAGTRFVDSPRGAQEQVLKQHDAAVFARPIAFPSPWFTTKALIVLAYYTSEAGASQELEYELAPGGYDVDVIVDAKWRPISNDWSANSIKKAIAGQ